MQRADSLKGYMLAWCCVATLFGATCASAVTFNAPPGKALVYVLQAETGRFANLLVSVNGRHVATLATNTWFAFAAEPGVQLVSVAATVSAATRLKVDAGKTYYLEQRVNAAGIPVFRVMPESQAQALMASYRPVRDNLVLAAAPLKSTAPAASEPALAPAPAPAPAPAAAPTPAPAKPKPVAKEPAPEPALVAREASAPDTRFMLQVKSGSFKLSETSQNWFDVPATVDDGSSGVFGVEFGYDFGSGWTIGAELFNYKNDWVQADGDSGSFKTYAITANGKKYFAVTDIVRPFVGLGLGLASTDFSGDIQGGSDGFAYQIVGGVQFRFKYVGVNLEVKSLSAETEAARAAGGTDTVDVSGRGVFLGVSGHF